jgi:uncharacterized protein with HEPN domain
VRLDRDRLLDMIEMCDLLLEHVAEPERLEGDPVLQAATQRWIEIIGEAASRLSDEFKDSHPEVQWRDLVGTRVILAHAYFHVDTAILGQVISDDIPQLRQQLDTIITELDER